MALHLRPGNELNRLHNTVGGGLVTFVFEQHRGGADRRDRVDLVQTGELRRGAADRLEHARPAGVRAEVRARRDAETALEDTRQVGDDVAEHIRRNDNVVIFRAVDHINAARVDVMVFFLNVRIFGADFLERPHPEVVSERKNVRFRDERNLFALRIVAAASVFKRPADAAFATFARVNRRLRRDFVRRSLLQESVTARRWAAT